MNPAIKQIIQVCTQGFPSLYVSLRQNIMVHSSSVTRVGALFPELSLHHQTEDIFPQMRYRLDGKMAPLFQPQWSRPMQGAFKN